MENRLVIEVDVGKRIQSFKNQVGMFVRERGGIQLKCGLILPVSQADPLEMELIISIKRVGDETAVQQVGLNHARNLRGMPFFGVGPIGVGYGAKLPA
jgi:hypothetical protein